MSKIRKFRLNIPKGVYIISATFLIVVLLMIPFRQLAFQDDFAYYLSVKNFLQTGQLKITEWAAPSLIFQVLWGSLFTSLFGLSYKMLHTSTAIIFFFGLISFYLLLKELKFSEGKSIIFTLIFLVFPGILQFTFTFMTDIPYLSLMLMSLYCGAISLKKDSWRFSLLSTVIAMAAFLTRQLGILLPISLFIAFIFKSIYKKKFLFKPILCILIVGLPVFIFYNNWLNLDDNRTSTQMLYGGYLNYLKMYWRPLGFHRLHPTNDIYDEATYRISHYLILTFVFLLPAFIPFEIYKIKRLLKVLYKEKASLLFGTLVMGLLYWRFFTRESAIPSILPGTLSRFSEVWGKIWHLLQYVAFPLWSYVVGKGLLKLHKAVFEKREKSKFLVVGLIALVFAIYYFANLNTITFQQTQKISWKDTFFIFLWLVVLTLFILQFAIYRFKLKVSNPSYTALFIFIFTAGLLHLLMTVFGFFLWQEYIFTLAPYLIIAILLILQSFRVNKLIALILLPTLIITFVAFTKLDYDINGLLWENSEDLVNAEIVDAREVGIVNWAWIPYFFYEESYEKRLSEVGGDKKLITQVHTWWDLPEYNYREQRLSFIPGSCYSYKVLPNEKILEQVEAKSIFASYKYCVILRL